MLLVVTTVRLFPILSLFLLFRIFPFTFFANTRPGSTKSQDTIDNTPDWPRDVREHKPRARVRRGEYLVGWKKQKKTEKGMERTAEGVDC